MPSLWQPHVARCLDGLFLNSNLLKCSWPQVLKCLTGTALPTAPLWHTP